MRSTAWILAFALAACGAEPGDAGDAPAADLRVVAEGALGPVTARVTMTPPTPRFGDRVTLELRADATGGAVLEAPDFGARLGHFRIRGREDTSRLDQGALRVAITAEPERTGTNIGRLPPLRFRVTTGEGAGSEQELVLAPFEVEVAGLTPDQQPTLADVGTPLPMVAPSVARDASLVPWLAGGLAVLAGVGLWLWRRRRAGAAEAAVEIDPREEAARAFAALRAAKLTEQGRFAEFYVRLTGIVRRYVERTTGVHAPEQTTEEFLREMERSPAFDGDRRRDLGEFLAAADLVKYAAQVPTGAELDTAVAAARAFCGLGAAGQEVAA